LRRSWEGEHHIVLGKRKEMTIKIREVRTAWQPVLSLYDYALDVAEDGTPVLANGMTEELLRKGWAVIDVGHNTTDVAGVINLQPITKYSSGLRFGGRNAIAAVKRAVKDNWDVSRQLAEIEANVRDGYIDIYDERKDLTPLALEATAGLASEIASDVSMILDDPSRFHGILLTGGPAPLIRPALAQLYRRNLVLMKDPQLANARGACKFAQGPVFKLNYVEE
jgi:hypothetical protein